jgi:hypothetical protein
LEKVLSQLPQKPGEPASAQDWSRHLEEQARLFRQQVEAGAPLHELLSDSSELFSSAAFRALSAGEKREVLDELDLPFSLLREIMPAAELAALLSPEETRFLGLEDLLSHDNFADLADFNSRISDLLRRVPDSDLEKLLRSPRVAPRVEAELRHQLLASGKRGQEVGVTDCASELEAWLDLGVSLGELAKEDGSDSLRGAALRPIRPGCRC